MIESWKSLAAYFENATGRALSDEAMRKWHARDTELKRIVTFVGSKPGAPRYLFDRWIAVQLLPKTKKRAVKRAMQAIQSWLPLF